MTRNLTRIVLMAAVVFAATPLMADDVTGVNTLLCSTATASACYDGGGECDSGPSWNLNIPSFIEVDLVGKRLNTTKASGENRTTPIKNLERAEGRIIMQGVEQGRAFSIMIDEATGALAAAVARDGVGVVVFGTCTPAGAGDKSTN